MSKKKNLNILAIYGIQDQNPDFPEISHDHAIAYFKNGELVKFIQQERVSRKKHDNALHIDLQRLLKMEGLVIPDNHTKVVFVDNVLGRSYISAKGNIRYEGPLQNKLSFKYEKGRCLWMGKEIEAYSVHHELAHVFSCLPYFGPFKENSMLLHFDGGASLSNCSVWAYKNKQVKLLDAHWQLKHLSDLFNSNALVFSILGGNPKNQQGIPGKMMGFASWGKYSKVIEDWLIKNQMFADAWNDTERILKEATLFLGKPVSVIDQKNPFFQDIIATMHFIFQRDFLCYLKKIQEKTQLENLYYSGGAALNIKVNKAIVDSSIFKNIYIPPCCNDSGLAIGGGAVLNHFLGFENRAISPYSNNWNINGKTPDKFDQKQLQEIASLLYQGNVIGVCNGPGETGPRALGNRSILALANSKKLAEKVSVSIKKREWYRPVAPIMLSKNLGLFTDDAYVPRLSKYMLFEYKVNSYALKQMEGAVHVDGTARIQTIENRVDNPFMYDLLSCLESKYKVRALINTSFNIAGEPIVHSDTDAVQSAAKMGLDALIIDGKYTNVKK